MPNTYDQQESAKKTGINISDYELIKSLMKREPNETELLIISKLLYEEPELIYSRNKLAKLAEARKPVLKGIKNNFSAAVEISREYACVINIRQGSEHKKPEETGVSTMARAVHSIVATGAKPVAHIFTLKYRPSKSDDIVNNVYKYSNDTSIPVIKGNICFNENLKQYPFLSTMTLGIIKKERLPAPDRIDTGQSVFILGFAGSDKKCGDSIWSLIKDKYSGSRKLPAVINHIRDKLLIEGVLELFDNGLINAAEVIGKTGIIGAAADMLSSGNAGVILNIDKLYDSPSKDSKCQVLYKYLPGSLLIIANKNRKELIEKILKKWLVDYCIIGDTIKQDNVSCYKNNESFAEIPVKMLVNQRFATREEKTETPDREFNIISISTENINEPEDYKETVIKLIKQPCISGKVLPMLESDSITGTVNMNISFPSDSGIIKINTPGYSLAATVSANSKYLPADIKTGTIILIAKAIRDIICSGCEPLAMSICLTILKKNNNCFREQFELIFDGIEEAIKQFKIPLANFNLSINPGNSSASESDNLAVVPAVYVSGELKSNKNHTTIAFRDKGHMIYLIGRSGDDIASSEYLKVIHGINQSPSPFMDINLEAKLHDTVWGLIKNHLIISAHNISEGGLFFALLESAIAEQYGFDITSPAEVRLDAFLFSEAQGRVIVTVSPIRETEFIDFMMQQDFPFSALGHITKEELRIDDISYGSINEYKDLCSSAIQSYMQ
ncbi:MAG: hypothetical protein JSV22_07555 [Bacteroidales bacterium]|nr:MAG: hypothetical protein JSV22_07555 [Bacteroidales bacterium]